MKFYLTDDVEVELVPNTANNSPARFIFDSDGCLVATGKVLGSDNITSVFQRTIGSETWITDESDLFRFSDHGSLELDSIVLKCPTNNIGIGKSIPLKPVELELNKVRICSNYKPFVVPPQSSMCFDVNNRRLIAFSVNSNEVCKLQRFYIAEGLAIFIDSEQRYSGWSLNDPLGVVTGAFNGNLDKVKTNSETYKLFAKYFEILSDQFCESKNDDMEEVVKELAGCFKDETLAKINGEKRALLLKNSIESLVDYFL